MDTNSLITTSHLELLYHGVAAYFSSCPFVLIQKNDPEASGQGGEFLRRSLRLRGTNPRPALMTSAS